MQRHKVFPPPIIIMASPEWSQFMLVPRYFIRNMAPAYQLLTAGPTYHTLHFLSTHSPHPVALHSLSLLPSLSPGRRRRSSGLPRRHRARRRQARQVRRAATGSGRRRGRGGPPPSSRWIPLPPPCSLPRRPWLQRRGAEARFVV